ncbi:hypothetical protein [Pararhizobium gei]|uniref:hypothetical protein n=1 Tax=Pararhizobium gei TaxID=1395951 RepID=UPI0023DBEB02|nr:hypothetical protein [Rhizobium gei]
MMVNAIFLMSGSTMLRFFSAQITGNRRRFIKATLPVWKHLRNREELIAQTDITLKGKIQIFG